MEATAHQLATIDGQPPPPIGTCTTFAHHDDSYAESQHHKLLIRNTAVPCAGHVKPLCLRWIVEDANDQIEVVPPWDLKKDEENCPIEAGWLAAVPANGPGATFNIGYSPSHSLDIAPLRLTVITNDLRQPPRTFCFGFAPDCRLEPGLVTFAKSAGGTTQSTCLTVYNIGVGGITVADAAIDPADGPFSIVMPPKYGEYLPGVSTERNSNFIPAAHVCVKYHSVGAAKPESALLSVFFDMPPGKCLAKLAVSLPEPGTLAIDCGNPSGVSMFSFPKPVPTTAVCTLCNQGPSAVHVQDVQIDGDGAADTASNLSVYKVAMLHNMEAPQAQTTLASQDCINLQVTFAPEAKVLGPPATVRFGYSSLDVAGQQTIPIVPGPCATPQLSLAPSLQVVRVPFGGTWKSTFAVANQSCSNLTILDVCATQPSNSYSQSCQDSSAHFSLSAGLAPTTLPPYGLLTFDVSYDAPTFKSGIFEDELLVTYCPGTFAAGACSTEPVVEAAALVAEIALLGQPAPPKAAIGVTTTQSDIVAGKPVELAVSITSFGGYPASSPVSYGWTVTKRPAGSATWILGAAQVTDAPTQTVVPDKSGEYEVAGQIYLGMDQGGAQSPQVKVAFTVM